MTEMKCPRCGVSLLGAVNCCWQCGLIVFAEAPERATQRTESNEVAAPISPSEENAGSVATEPGERAAATLVDAAPGGSHEAAIVVAVIPAQPSPREEIVEAQIVDDATIEYKPVRIGSPFAGVAASPTPSTKRAAPSVAVVHETPAWILTAIETAPYGCAPLAFYALAGALLAKDGFGACFPAALAFAFGLLGISHESRGQRLWSWGGLGLALFAAMVGIWR